ncbi:hypothetical protein ONE63_005312 [Megalurothrips usitatus]|uniref:Uncharacterized protein n=1 Tax=Megalurothrips usitatus TaxID=439358 RepID=A0AAV7XVM6_9NEOP|nr:hypothetical protein ONE63_005312 [Megalurothrips usitatus]
MCRERQPHLLNTVGDANEAVVVCAGVVDPEAGPAHPDGGRAHVHVGPALHRHPAGPLRELDAADPVGAGQGLGHLRVPGQHGAQDEPVLPAQRHRVEGADPGLVGPARQDGLLHHANVRAQPGPARPGHGAVVPQRPDHLQPGRPGRAPQRAGPGAARQDHGDVDGGAHLQAAHHVRQAVGLGQLHLQAHQPGRLGQRQRARHQRGAPSGDAARQQEQGERPVPALPRLLHRLGHHAEMKLEHRARDLDVDLARNPVHRGAALYFFEKRKLEFPFFNLFFIKNESCGMSARGGRPDLPSVKWRDRRGGESGSSLGSLARTQHQHREASSEPHESSHRGSQTERTTRDNV